MSETTQDDPRHKTTDAARAHAPSSVSGQPQCPSLWQSVHPLTRSDPPPRPHQGRPPAKGQCRPVTRTVWGRQTQRGDLCAEEHGPRGSSVWGRPPDLKGTDSDPPDKQRRAIFTRDHPLRVADNRTSSSVAGLDVIAHHHDDAGRDSGGRACREGLSRHRHDQPASDGPHVVSPQQQQQQPLSSPTLSSSGGGTRPDCPDSASRPHPSTPTTPPPPPPRAASPVGGVMNVLPIRKFRQWAGVGLPVAAALYMVVYCYSTLVPSLTLRPLPLHNTLAGSGFRKLLEDQERAARAMAHVNASRAPYASYAQRLPACIIVGVRKCGTRALLEFLSLHPDVVTAEDEMHFFNDDERYRLGLEWYRHNMPPSLPHQLTLEKTPGYFISPITPSRIHRMNSTVRLIVLLRHPTTRTVSDYTQIYYNKQSKNESIDPFEDMVVDPDTGGVNTRYKAVQISVYHRHFRHWLDVFPRRQIHVVDGDRLITDPVSEIQQIEDFLGLAHRVNYDKLYFNVTRGFYCMRKNATVEKCLGASKGRRHPVIQRSVIRKLNRFFQPHNKQLFDLTHLWFPWS